MNLKTGALAFLVALAAAMPNPDVHHKHSDVTGHHHREGNHHHPEGQHPKHKLGKHFEKSNHTESHDKHYGLEHLRAKRDAPGVYGFYECSLPDWQGDCKWTEIFLGEAKCYNAQYEGKGSFGPDQNVMCTMYALPDCADQGTQLPSQTYPGLSNTCANGVWAATSTSCPGSYKCVAAIVGDIAMKTTASKRDIENHPEGLEHTETAPSPAADPRPDGLELIRAKRADPVYGFYECSSSNWQGDCHWTQVLPGEVQCYNRRYQPSGGMGPDQGVMCNLYSEPNCAENSFMFNDVFPGAADCQKNADGSAVCPMSYKCKTVVEADGTVLPKPPNKRDVGNHSGVSDYANTEFEHEGLEHLRAKRAALVSATNATYEISEHGIVKRAEPTYGFYECTSENFKGICHWTQIKPGTVECFDTAVGDINSFGPDPGVTCIAYSISGCVDVSYVSKPITHPGWPTCKKGKLWAWGQGLSPCPQAYSCAVPGAAGNTDPLNVQIYPGFGDGTGG